MKKTLSVATLLILMIISIWLSAFWPTPNTKSREIITEVPNLPPITFKSEGISKIGFHPFGKGASVFLLPSAGRSASDFNELTFKLAENGYKAIPIDSPSIGYSAPIPNNKLTLTEFANPVTGLASNMSKNNDDGIVIIGHAYGNRVARMVAYQNPENINAVILLAAGGQVPPEPEIEATLKRIFNPLKSYRSRMKDVRTAFFAEGNEIPKQWTRGWHRKVAIAQGKATGDGDESWHCAAGVPMLIVQPMQDIIAPPANAYALRNKCPQKVEIVEIENAGHALLPEQPDAVAEAVLAFLAKHHVAIADVQP